MDAGIRRVVWTGNAKTSLEDAISYVAKDDQSAALNLLDRILAKAESLGTFSERGRMVPELARPEVREVLIHSYRLLYHVTASEVRILSLLHGARDFETWRISHPDV